MTERDELPPGWEMWPLLNGPGYWAFNRSTLRSGNGATEPEAIRAAWRIHDAEKEKDA